MVDGDQVRHFVIGNNRSFDAADDSSMLESLKTSLNEASGRGGRSWGLYL